MDPAPRSRRSAASGPAPRRARAGSRAPRWERKAEERPSALLEAALDAFARHGFHATRLETIAEAAGVSKGTVYTYFENKEDLLRKAIEHRQEANKAGVEAQFLHFRGSAEEKLRLFLERLWAKTLTEDWGRMHKLMHGEIADEAPELYRFWIRNGLLRGWKLVAGILAEGQAAGEFRADADADALARFLLSGLMNQAFLQVHMGIGKLDAFPLERIYAAGVDTLLAGIRAPRSGRASRAGSVPDRKAPSRRIPPRSRT